MNKIALFVAVTFIFLGLYAYNKSTTNPQITTEQFYKEYIACLQKNNTSTPFPQQCLDDGSQYLSTTFYKSIKENKLDSNPFTCNTITPLSFKINKTSEYKNKANSIIIVNFGDKGVSPIDVSLELQDNKWKISGLSCIPI